MVRRTPSPAFQRPRPQRVEILVAIGGLGLAQETLERIIIGGGDTDLIRRTGRPRRTGAATAQV